MKKPNTGYFWHVHHGVLIEHCYNARERRRYIRSNKSGYEVQPRLRFMQPARLPVAVKKALAAYTRGAGNACPKSGKLRRALDRLHKKQCKGCSWNGTELVF